MIKKQQVLSGLGHLGVARNVRRQLLLILTVTGTVEPVFTDHPIGHKNMVSLKTGGLW